MYALIAAVKDGGQTVVGVVVGVAGTVGTIAANAKQIEKGVKTIVDASEKVVKIVLENNIRVEKI